MLAFTDQTGHKIYMNGIPQRIISIVPSQSELLWDLGVQEELVGITKFCIHPEEMFLTVKRVGGTKKLNIGAIRALKPDLIIGNKEENEKEQIELLRKEFNVWMSDIYSFGDAFEMMTLLGDITGRKEKAEEIVNRIRRLLPGVRNIFPDKRVAYFIWNDPYMLAAENTFIDHVLKYAGFTNAAQGLLRYPQVSAQVLKELEPDICFLSSEPFPFKQKHVEELQRILPQSEIRIVDGEMFSWYGSRLQKLPAYLKELKEGVK